MKYLIAAGFILISFNSMANNDQLKKPNIPEQAQESIKTENDFINAAIKEGRNKILRVEENFIGFQS